MLRNGSAHLTTFITPWGHFGFKRNAMGLASARDEHNMRGEMAIQGIPNVKKIVEDILIYDKDYDTHLKRVRLVLHKCCEHGIINWHYLTLEKSSLCTKESPMVQLFIV